MCWFDFQIGVWFCEWLLGSKGIGNKIDMRSMGRRRSELDYKELKICEHVLIGFILICLAQVSLGATNLQDGKGQPSFICWLLFSIEILISLCWSVVACFCSLRSNEHLLSAFAFQLLQSTAYMLRSARLFFLGGLLLEETLVGKHGKGFSAMIAQLYQCMLI